MVRQWDDFRTFLEEFLGSSSPLVAPDRLVSQLGGFVEHRVPSRNTL
jgi:hypothetical protein